MNMVILSGNIGSEPEFSEYADGTRRVSFSVALDQYNKSGEKTDVLWFYCCAWDSVSDRRLPKRAKHVRNSPTFGFPDSFMSSAFSAGFTRFYTAAYTSAC